MVRDILRLNPGFPRLFFIVVRASPAEPLDCVNLLVLRLIVDAYQNLTNQSNGEKLDSCEHQGCRKETEGAVFLENMDATENLPVDEKNPDQSRKPPTAEGELSEKMEGTRHVPQKKAHRYQVEKDSERSGKPVMGTALISSHVFDGNLDNVGTIEGCEGRDKSVQIPVKM